MTLGLVSIISLAYLWLFARLEKNLHSFVSEMESQLNLTERDSLYKFPAPALIVDSDGIIIWFNKAFTEQIHSADAYGVHLSKIIDIDLESSFEQMDRVIEYNTGHYRVRAVTTSKTDENHTAVSELTLLYFQDITELITIRSEYERSRDHAAFIIIDSFEEMFSKVKDSEKAQITLQIDKLVEGFAEVHNSVLKKMSSDRYFVVLREEELVRLENEQFKSLIDEAHKILVSDHTHQ